MADQEIKRILVKWGIDASDWKSAFTELLQLQAQAAADQKKADNDKKTALADALAQQKLSTGEAKAATAELVRQQAEAKVLQQQQAAVKAETSAKLEQERLVTAEINKQTAALKLQMAQQKASQSQPGGGGQGGAGGGGGFGGALLGGFASKFSGSIAAGVIAGGGMLLIIQAIGKALGDVIVNLYEVGKTVGPIQQLADQFERLSAGKGVDPAKFFDELGTASLGLVSKMDLLRFANASLRSNLGLSEQQIVKLTSSTVNLALANGKTATQAIQSLNQAMLTGRAQLLARVTGITRAELTVRGLGAALSDTDRSQATFDKVMDTINTKAEATGPPLETLTMKLDRVSVSIKNFYTDMILGLYNSAGFSSFQEGLGKVIDTISSSLKNLGPIISESLGAAFGAVTSLISTLVEGAKAIVNAFSTAGKTLGLTDALKGVLTPLQAFKATVETVKGLFDLIGISVKNMGAAFLLITQGNWSGLKQLIGNDQTERQGSINKTYANVASAAGLTPGGSITGKRPPINPSDSDDENLKAQRQLATAKLAERKKEIDDELAQEKSRLEELRQMDQESYDQGKQALADYVEYQKGIRQQEHDAQIQAIKDRTTAQLAQIQQQVAGNQITPAVGALQTKGVLSDADKQKLAADDLLNKQEAALDKQAAKDHESAMKVAYKDELEAAQQSLADQQKALQESYANQEVTTGEFVSKRIDQLEQEYTAFAAEKQKEYNDTAVKNEQQLALLNSALAKKRQATDNAETDLTRNQFANSNTQQEKLYSEQEASLKAQLALATEIRQQGGQGQLSQDEISLNAQLLSLEQQRTENLKAMAVLLYDQPKILEAINKALAQSVKNTNDLKTSPVVLAAKAATDSANVQLQLLQAQAGAPGGVQTNDQQIAIYQQLNAALETQASKINDQLSPAWINLRVQILKNNDAIAQLQSASAELFLTLAEGLASITSSLQSAFGHGSNFFSQLGTAAKPGSSLLQTLGTYQQQAPGLGFANQNPIEGLSSSFQDLIEGAGDVNKNLKEFTNSLGASAATVGTFIQAIQGKGGPVQAGISGLTSGGGIGDIANGLLSHAGGILGSLSDFAGPIGSAVGAIVGIFSGIFEQAAQKMAQNLTNSFNQVSQALGTGAISLSQALAQETAIMNQAIAQLSGQKGGQSQLAQILPGMQATIEKLQDQQAQIFKTMDETTQMLSAPQAYDSQISQINQILTQYQNYIDAGGQVAEANEFLTESFQRLSSQGYDTLIQDQETAIQDALNLMDLQQQQSDLAVQTADQIYAIQTQGSLVRSRSATQTKLEQITQIQQQAADQQQQISEEIALAAYKVNAESQVFSLATTRIGLETQLLALQSQQTNEDMVRIQALQNLLATINAGGTSINSISALLQGLGLVPSSAPTSDDTSDLITALQGTYGQYGSQGLGGFTGETP